MNKKEIIISYGIKMDQQDIYDYCNKYLKPINLNNNIIEQVYNNFYSIDLLSFNINDTFNITHLD